MGRPRPRLWPAFWLTIQLTVYSAIGAMFFGTILTAMRVSPVSVLRGMATFYINTVRDFRDRRYDYKGKAKVWKGKTESLKSSGATSSEVDAAKKMMLFLHLMSLLIESQF